MSSRRLVVALAGIAAALPIAAVGAESILFIGNSFTYGEGASVQNYRTNSVTDLRGTNIGGVPALFKSFTEQAGLSYDVFLETQPGSNLDYHYNTQLSLINRSWDNVVMHGQSNLNFAAPNNPALISQYTGLLGAVFQAQNPNVDISLTATWSRADLTYLTTSPWLGLPIEQMAIDLQKGYEVVLAQNPSIVDRINPVGLVWNASFASGLADRNPYDGIGAGQINLWAADEYHASNFGYYLHALTVFGLETGIDPRTLGANERAAADLGFTPQQAAALQAIAFQVITPVPEPETWATLALGLAALGVVSQKRLRQAAPA